MPAKLTKRPGKKEFYYEPVNYCIYCKRDRFTENELTDEHIIPYALNGGRVLPKASCKVCARIINSEFETYVLQKMFGVPRAQLKMQTRKKGRGKQGNNKKPKVSAITKRGKPAPSLVDPGKAPILIQQPLYSPPSKLWDAEPTEIAVPERLKFRWFGGITDRVLNEYDEGLYQHIERKARTDYLKFARFLAKVAHGYFIAECRGYHVEPFLNTSILTNTSEVLQHVGNLFLRERTSALQRQSGLHQVSLRWEGELALVSICLFSDMNAPTYCVVAGKRFLR